MSAAWTRRARLLDEVTVVERLAEERAGLAAAARLPRHGLAERVDEAAVAALAEGLAQRGEGGGREDLVTYGYSLGTYGYSLVT